MLKAKMLCPDLLRSYVKSRQLSDLTESMQRPSDTDTIMILVEFIRNPNRTFEQLSLNLKKVGI